MHLFSWLHKRLTGRPQTRPSPGRKPIPRFRPQLEVLEGRDLPSFASPVAYGPYYMATLVSADANGDGKPDLLTSPSAGGAGTQWLNNGNGSFVEGHGLFDWGQSDPTAMAVGDVNGDGKLDFVFADQPSTYPTTGPQYVTVTVGLGNAQGGFTPALDPFGEEGILPGPVASMALADVYGNGKLDIVAAGKYGEVYVARNEGYGLFAVAQYYATPGFGGQVPVQVTVGDLNGDGKLDIIVTNPFNSVSVLLNNGNGAFAPAQTYSVGGTPTAVAVGDFNRDGKLDIVTTNSNGTVSVLLNNGNGAFGTVQNYAIGGPANSVAVGDFNHDGYVDIATTGSTEMDMLLNNGNGTFGPYQKVGPAGSSVVAADFNSDGYPDLAELVGTGLIKSIDVLYNNPNGSLTGAGFPSSTTAGVAHSFTVTALNADGTVNTSYSGTVHFSSSDPQAVLPANYTFRAADHGVHTFSVTLKTAGSYQFITATDTNNSSLVGGELGITVAPAAAVALVFGNVPSGLTAGFTFNLWLTAKDAYGNTATGYTGTVHFTSSDPHAVLPADFTFTSGNAGNVYYGLSVALKTAGPQSVTATDTVTRSITSTTSGIAVFPAAASQFILSAPATVTSGAKFSLTLTVEDAYGNVVPYYAFTVHFSSSDSTAKLPTDYTFTYSDAGVHTFKNAFILKHMGTQTITVTDTQIASLTVTVSIDVI